MKMNKVMLGLALVLSVGLSIVGGIVLADANTGVVYAQAIDAPKTVVQAQTKQQQQERQKRLEAQKKLREKRQAERKAQQTQSNTPGFEYSAQPGDSYTLMARKAVQTYGIINNVKLSNAAIIFAETNITQEAGSPYLNLGQAVKIDTETVRDWVKKAEKLSDKELAAWSMYVSGANFNTNAVGQTAS